MRGFRKDAIKKLGLRSIGMEFASEMLVKPALLGLRIAEIPANLSPDGRTMPPHYLRTWRDGWRDLRFMLLFSPRWLFLYPGLLLMLVGTLLSSWLLLGPRYVGRLGFDLNTLLYSAVMIVLGYRSDTADRCSGDCLSHARLSNDFFQFPSERPGHGKPLKMPYPDSHR
jgi:hypothetical protein